jgi:hypothetical protein
MTMRQPPKLNDLAKASVWTAIAGLAFPVSLVVLATTSEQHRLDIGRLGEWPYVLCSLLFVILELVALGCGLAARGTVTGKRGLGLVALAWHLLASTLFAFGGTLLPVLILTFGMLLLYSIALLWRLLSARPSAAGLPQAQTDHSEERAQGQTGAR